jgi:hypothetical protein
MAKGKALDWNEAEVESRSEVSARDFDAARAWATPKLRALLDAQPDEQIIRNGDSEGGT